MFSTGEAHITETGADVRITIKNRHRIIRITGQILIMALAILFTMVFGGGALGFIGRDTMTAPVRILAALGGIFGIFILLAAGFNIFQTFDTLELYANKDSFRVRRTSIFRDLQKDYPWNKIDRFTEVLPSQGLSRGLTMILAGQIVWLHASLTVMDAEAMVVALSRCHDRWRDNRA